MSLKITFREQYCCILAEVPQGIVWIRVAPCAKWYLCSKKLPFFSPTNSHSISLRYISVRAVGVWIGRTGPKGDRPLALRADPSPNSYHVYGGVVLPENQYAEPIGLESIAQIQPLHHSTAKFLI